METQANEMEGTEDENCDVLMVDEDHIALYDDKFIVCESESVKKILLSVYKVRR